MTTFVKISQNGEARLCIQPNLKVMMMQMATCTHLDLYTEEELAYGKVLCILACNWLLHNALLGYWCIAIDYAIIMHNRYIITL